MMLAWLVSVAFAQAPEAAAPEARALSVGVGAGIAHDLADFVSHEYANFKVGPALQIPVRWRIGERAALRATFRAEIGTGYDRVTWTDTIDGADVTFYHDDHWAMLFGKALTIGVDAGLPGDMPVVPYLGAEAGGAHVTTYHSLGDETQVLLDPEQNELDNPRNIDPYTAQTTVVTDLHVGAMFGGGSGPTPWIELGYAIAFVEAAPLRKTPAELSAMREPYGWNATRVIFGVDF